MPRSKKNNRMNNLRRRFNNLKKKNSNEFNIVDSLEDIGNKSNQLLVKHEYYNKQKILKNKDINIKKYINTLLGEYKLLIDSCNIYKDNISINNLKKSLIKNYNNLLNDIALFNSDNYNNSNIPSLDQLEKRFKKLSKFADKIRKNKKIKIKK